MSTVKESNFDNYGDYIEAKILEKLDLLVEQAVEKVLKKRGYAPIENSRL